MRDRTLEVAQCRRHATGEILTRAVSSGRSDVARTQMARTAVIASTTTGLSTDATRDAEPFGFCHYRPASGHLIAVDRFCIGNSDYLRGRTPAQVLDGYPTRQAS